MVDGHHKDTTRKTTDLNVDVVKRKRKEKQVEEPKPTGRPSEFTQDIADRICAEITLGSSLRTALTGEDMPAAATFYRWLREHDAFQKQYARACEERTEAMAEDLLDIVDDGTNDWMEYYDKEGEAIGWKLNGEHVQRSKLRADTRKWLMSKMKPKKYGDKLDLTSDGKQLPTPILGGLSNTGTRTDGVQSDDSDS